jgi:NH3-dependent NAD+ synthetase
MKIIYGIQPLIGWRVENFLANGGKMCRHNSMKLSKKHTTTLKAIFQSPTKSTIRWNDFKGLIIALGGSVDSSGKTGGSRQRIRLKTRRAVLHKPHPGSEMVKASVESARDFLRSSGVEPNQENE